MMKNALINKNKCHGNNNDVCQDYNTTTENKICPITFLFVCLVNMSVICHAVLIPNVDMDISNTGTETQIKQDHA